MHKLHHLQTPRGAQLNAILRQSHPEQDSEILIQFLRPDAARNLLAVSDRLYPDQCDVNSVAFLPDKFIRLFQTAITARNTKAPEPS